MSFYGTGIDWDAAAGSAAGVTVPADGSIGVTGLEWMGARAYDPAARRFLSVDPMAPVSGTAWGSNPYSYAGNDPVHAVDPLGLRPITDEELQAYAYERRGSLVDVAETAGQWFSENWEWFAGGAAIIAGGVLIATGVGGPLGLMLIAAGADTIIQKATTYGDRYGIPEENIRNFDVIEQGRVEPGPLSSLDPRPASAVTLEAASKSWSRQEE